MLQQSYSGVWNSLKTAGDPGEAAKLFMLKFERPADQSAKAQNERAGYANQFYNTYASSATSSSTTENNAGGFGGTGARPKAWTTRYGGGAFNAGG